MTDYSDHKENILGLTNQIGGLRRDVGHWKETVLAILDEDDISDMRIGLQTAIEMVDNMVNLVCAVVAEIIAAKITEEDSK